jgi:WD40 repeat protein
MSVGIIDSPYKGLAPFGDSDLDALLFFGRGRETETIAANLQASRLTVLYGPSGVGKSSILRAGAVHRLRKEPDVEVQMLDSWEGDAVTALRDAAAWRDGRDLYLILDQFEEYFVYHGDDEAVAVELGELLSQSRVNVLIGIRDDALARLDAFKRRLPELLGNRLRLEHLDRRAGEEAIRGPITAYNRGLAPEDHVDIDDDLVAAVLDDVAVGRVRLRAAGRGSVTNGASADRIEAPFLQLVLERIWETERSAGSNRLRLETFRSLGGAARIVRDHLEKAMGKLPPAEQEAAAAMYDHLVTPSGTKIAHEVGDLAGYANVSESEAASVLQKLTRERVLRSSSDDGAAGRRYEIYHDVLADAVLEWHARHESRRLVHEAERRRRRAFSVATGALLALIIVAAIAVFALVERGRARNQSRHARAGQLVAEARNDLDVDPRQSIALALQAARREHSTHVEDVLRDSLIASRVRAVVTAPGPVVASGRGFFVVGDARGRLRTVRGEGLVFTRRTFPSAVTAVATGPEGSIMAGTNDGAVVAFRDGRETSHQVEGNVTALAIGREAIAAGTGKGLVSVWRGGGGKRSKVLRVRGSVTALAFSPDQRLLLVTSRDRRARLVDVRTGRVLHVLTQRGYVDAAAFSPDGRVVVTGSEDRTGRMWDARTGRVLHSIAPAAGGLTAIAFSADGALVAIASADGVSRVYDGRSGAFRFYLSGDTNAITDIGFNPSGTALVTASADRTTRIWAANVGRQLEVLRGHTSTVLRAFFSSDGKRVVTAGVDDSVRVWDPGTEPEMGVLLRQKTRFARANRQPDGRILVTDITGLTHVLDPMARRVLRTFRMAPPRSTPAEAVHGDLVARAGPNDFVTVTRRGRTIRRFAAAADALEFSPDGRLLASGGSDNFLRVWDVGSGRQLYAFVAHQGPVQDVSFSPDGRWIVTAGPISAGVWSAATGRPLLLLHGPTQPLHAALFTQDGRTIVTAGYDDTIRTYECVVCGTFSQLVRAAELRLAQTRPR